MASAFRLNAGGFAVKQRAMQGFIYFNITDHARLPARFFGMTRTILAQLG